MYVYLIETKAVFYSAFPAFFYLTLVYCPPFWYGQPLGYGGDRAYADSKHVFASTQLASSFPGWRKAGQGAWERGYAPTLTGECMSFVSNNSKASTQAWWGQSVTWWGWSVTLWSRSANSCWQPSWGVAAWGTRVDFQLDSIINLWTSIPTTSFNIV